MLCINSWFIWQCISCFRWHEKPAKSNVKWKDSFLDSSPILGEGWLVGNYIYHCHSCLDSSVLWTLHCTMHNELCDPKVGVVLPNWRSESQGAIYPCEWCSYYELRASGAGEWRRKETEQAPTWKQASILSQTVDFELYAQDLWKPHTNWKTRQAPPPDPVEESQGSSYSPSPKRIP